MSKLLFRHVTIINFACNIADLHVCCHFFQFHKVPIKQKSYWYFRWTFIQTMIIVRKTDCQQSFFIIIYFLVSRVQNESRETMLYYWFKNFNRYYLALLCKKYNSSCAKYRWRGISARTWLLLVTEYLSIF
jgi:hypothetical protein